MFVKVIHWAIMHHKFTNKLSYFYLHQNIQVATDMCSSLDPLNVWEIWMKINLAQITQLWVIQYLLHSTTMALMLLGDHCCCSGCQDEDSSKNRALYSAGLQGLGHSNLFAVEGTGRRTSITSSMELEGYRREFVLVWIGTPRQRRGSSAAPCWYLMVPCHLW